MRESVKKRHVSILNVYGIRFMWMLAILANIKSIFCDVYSDQAYAVVTSWRHISGDKMFQEMAEPHQTSAFLTDLLMKIYRIWVPDYTGVVIFLQFCGVILYTIITFLLFRFLLKRIDRYLSHIICILLFTFRVKQIVFPEFSNMQIAFSVLLFMCMVCFYENQRKWYYLVLMGIFLCLEILSYPACLLIYFLVVGWLFQCTETKWKNIFLFTSTCALIGLVYVFSIVREIGFNSFFENLGFITESDKSHSEWMFMNLSYWSGAIYGCIWILICFLLAVSIYCILKRKLAQPRNFLLTILGGILLCTDVLMIFVSTTWAIDWSYNTNIVFPFLIILGLTQKKLLNSKEKLLCYSSTVLSIGSVLAVSVLTNLGLITILGYLIVGVALALIPLWKNHKVFVITMCFMVIMHRGLVVNNYGHLDDVRNTFQVENYVRIGPAKGVVTSLNQCNRLKNNMEDWKQYVQTGDVVLAVSGWMIDPLVYMGNESYIGTYSTINTPTYDQSLIKYWQKYPAKMPTVIAIEASNGNVSIDINDELNDFFEQNYRWVGDGKQWKFYRDVPFVSGSVPPS